MKMTEEDKLWRKLVNVPMDDIPAALDIASEFLDAEHWDPDVAEFLLHQQTDPAPLTEKLNRLLEERG